VGGGFNDYESAWLWQAYAPEGAVRRAVHSIYFRVLGEQGFAGLFLFLGLLFASWRSCSRVRQLTRGAPERRWAYDLASMLQVTLVAYMVSGAFLPMSYFDLTYQLMALSALLAAFCMRETSATGALSQPSVRRRVAGHHRRGSRGLATHHVP
jgi:probable O-glycosylation ligase (exosortase A-associated)